MNRNGAPDRSFKGNAVFSPTITRQKVMLTLNKRWFIRINLSLSLFLSLSPSQEELRELREQPIDPQAEQEIIDSIEEVYFSDDSTDMVQYELEVCLLTLTPVLTAWTACRV